MPEQTANVNLSLMGVESVRVDADAVAKTCRVRVPPENGSVADLTLDDWEKLTMSLSLGTGLGITVQRPVPPIDAVPTFRDAGGGLVTVTFNQPIATFDTVSLPQWVRQVHHPFLPLPGNLNGATALGGGVWELAFDGGALEGSTITVPASDPAVRTSTGGYVVAGNYTVQPM
jgi:hypothetical protein